MKKIRSLRRKLADFITFPIRACLLFGGDRWGLTSRASERYDYVAREVRGHCLDVGCGRHNRFINEFLGGNGVGIDVYSYEGLDERQVLDDITRFPFPDGTFDTVTFIACINHVPASLRDIELAEAYRVLKRPGNVIVTMGNPLGEILSHLLVHWHDKLFATRYDLDMERGMGAEEALYLTDAEICERLKRAGFEQIRKKYFWTQWVLNHLFIGNKV